MAKLRVRVVHSNRDGLLLRWKCPRERRWKERAAGTKDLAEAKQAAAELLAALKSGSYSDPSRVTWDEFRDKYETQKLPGLAQKTENRALTALNCVEALLRPAKLGDCDAQGVSLWQERMRAKGLSETTIATNLRHLKAALSWAKSQGMLREVPNFAMPKRGRRGSVMRGRPLTEAEFEQLLSAVPSVRPDDAENWQRLLRGLWLSGLRIAEAVALSWDRDSAVSIDQSGALPVLWFDADGHKSHKDERTPITPDFAKLLLETAADERVGRVFKLEADDGNQVTAEWAGKVVGRIGKAAGIIVNARDGKHASAHDLRRSFGTRWATRNVSPAMLKRLMRHASIQTTLAFYVFLEPDSMTGELWQRFG